MQAVELKGNSLLEYLGIKPNSRVLVEKHDDGTITLTPAKKVRASDIRGILKTDIHASDEEIQREIERGYAVRGMAGLA